MSNSKSHQSSHSKPEPDSTEETVAEVIEPVLDKREEYKEKWQRALAELENMRKRQDQERANLVQFGLKSFLEDLLPVVDNFYRAMEHIPEEQRNLPWVTGIQYIQKNMLDVLAGRGVQEIVVKPGDTFDPHKHEAISKVENPDFGEDQIVTVNNKGYMLQDRVLRPAQVTVNKQQ